MDTVTKGLKPDNDDDVQRDAGGAGGNHRSVCV